VKHIYTSFLFLFIFVIVAVNLSAQDSGQPQKSLPIGSTFSVELPDIIMTGIFTEIDIHVKVPSGEYSFEGLHEVLINEQSEVLEFENGQATTQFVFEGTTDFSVQIDTIDFHKNVTPIPLWLSILPPLIAILMALLFKEVYTALFIGILVGTFIIFFYRGQSFFEALFNGFFAVIDTYILESMENKDHLSIIIFSMLIGGMVGVISKNGGMKGIVGILSKHANNARSGQLVTWLMGILIFFDDYANTLVVGNTMRPVTDRLKISREKLAYIVDSTAAPVASVAFVTTWIGAELSYIQDGIKSLGLDETPYDVFLGSLQYSYYPILALIFIVFLVWKRRDFGPMYKAEMDARTGVKTSSIHAGLKNQVSEFEDENLDENKVRGYNAFIPVAVVVLGTIAGLIVTGMQAVGWDSNIAFSTNLANIIGNSNSFSALLWASLAGVAVAITLTVFQRILSLRKSIDALIGGFQTMLTAVVILILAWSIALITEHIHTAEFISGSLIKFQLSPYLVPALTFLLAALVSFSTGSSWGTMAILYPLMLPASWLICTDYGMDYDTSIVIFHNVVSAVLAGSVLGDHCSPISDTTILSSLASSCNHIDHVRTQMPYALTVGGVGMLLGTVPAAYGVPAYILFPINILVLFLIVHFAGKRLPKTYIQHS
jgi:Na+/H+ antiporter NhaC